MRKRLPRHQRHRHRIKPLLTLERDRRYLGTADLGQRIEVAKPRPELAAIRIADGQGALARPREVDEHGVVVAENRAVLLEKQVARVVERGGLQRERRGAAVPDLVDGLARVDFGRVVAEEGLAAGNGGYVVLDQLEPGVAHAVFGAEDAGNVACARVARVGVAKDNDGIARGVSLDVVRHLAEIGGSG